VPSGQPWWPIQDFPDERHRKLVLHFRRLRGQMQDVNLIKTLVVCDYLVEEYLLSNGRRLEGERQPVLVVVARRRYEEERRRRRKHRGR
jgi:hypothetical protein